MNEAIEVLADQVEEENVVSFCAEILLDFSLIKVVEFPMEFTRVCLQLLGNQINFCF